MLVGLMARCHRGGGQIGSTGTHEGLPNHTSSSLTFARRSVGRGGARTAYDYGSGVASDAAAGRRVGPDPALVSSFQSGPGVGVSSPSQVTMGGWKHTTLCWRTSGGGVPKIPIGPGPGWRSSICSYPVCISIRCCAAGVSPPFSHSLGNEPHVFGSRKSKKELMASPRSRPVICHRL